MGQGQKLRRTGRGFSLCGGRGEDMDEKRFEAAKNKIIGKTREKTSIGTFREKTVHAVLKHYYSPDENTHEVAVGNYVADIFDGKSIWEIQNGNFYKIRAKLDAFLAQYPVTIVFPIPHHKWLIWIDEETGELSPKRKSPLTGNAYRAFPELYRIKSYLANERLRFIFPLVDMEEYRLLNGWSKDRKKGSHRYDRIPIGLFDEVRIETRADYLQFLPDGLPSPFTSGDFAKTAKIPVKTARNTLHILTCLDIIKIAGKRGNAYLYQRSIPL